MKKTILILSVLFFSCQKDCYLIDSAGNPIPYTKDVRSAYSEYLSKGETTINGNKYYKIENDLLKVCN